MLFAREKANYFVGIGAQKAGTTWLADYLHSHKEVLFSPIKELHYFDSVYRSDLCPGFNPAFIKRLINQCSSINTGKEVNKISMVKALLSRVEMISNPEAYKEFFASRITNEKVFGEISPSYCMLEEDGFAAIKSMYPQAKFIFLLRNPADRYWSQLRYDSRLSDDRTATTEFDKRLADPRYLLRSDYQRTLTELFKVVSSEDVLILFYENIFNDVTGKEEMRKLCNFLNIKYKKPNLGKQVYVSKKEDFTSQQRQVAIERFSNVYKYVYDMFDGNIPNNWLEDMQHIN